MLSHPLLVGMAIGTVIGAVGVVAAHVAAFGWLARGHERKASR